MTTTPPADGTETADLPAADTVPAALELLDVETQKLRTTVATLGDADMRAPSLCAGWSRAHVITHLARNAESLVRLVVWARTGVVTPQYPSAETRNADIEAGAGRSAAELRDDLETACDLVRDALAALALPLASPLVDVAAGPTPARLLPLRRLNEVVLHHHDLDTGWTAADAHPLAVVDCLELAVGRLRRIPHSPGLLLRSDEGDEYVVGDGAVAVRGTAAALLTWLARADTTGIGFDGGALPQLPSGP